MKSTILFPALVLLHCFVPIFSQDTFSIVAVDVQTGEVGSAGASCVDNAAQFGGVVLISGILPGRGAINGQASVCIPHVNLNNGIAQMAAGLSPQEVLDYLFANDACTFGNANNRQYGVVDFAPDDTPRAAAFTGSLALSHASHRVGPNYAIQGNILLGPQILDSMEARFLAADGPLAVKLMAAMQGANVPGADSRCLDEGTSSKSAFLRVARPDDTPGNFYLDINIAQEPNGTEPINSLQTAFNAWADTALVNKTNEVENSPFEIFPNPASNGIRINWTPTGTGASVVAAVYLPNGQLLHKMPLQTGWNNLPLATTELSAQLVFVKISEGNGQVLHTAKIILSTK